MMLVLRDYLEKKGENTVFLNLDIETDKQFFSSQASLINKIRLEIGEKLEEYLDFGGYPRVVLEDLLTEKTKIINEIYQSYLEKDITYLLRIRKTEEFSHLVRVLASQIGCLLNASEISRTLGISQKTVKDYLWYLQKTFVLDKVTPYFKNIRKEIIKSPVFYFYDLGLRNYAVGLFGNIKNSHDKGKLFENYVFNILKERFQESPFKIHFWRTKYGAEVDFVLDFTRTQIPMEVKYRDLKKPEITRSFHNFVSKYNPEKAYIVNLGLDHTLSEKNTDIQFIPFFRLFESLL